MSAVLSLLASGCALGAPEPIPADEVLMTPQPPAPGEVALGEEFHAADVGADNLRGFLSAD
ncbi:MAG: hypothetical protein WAU68_09065 [Vitreimonas sp.]